MSVHGPLWAVTAYFNPAGFKRKLANYRAFRRHLSAPLLAVEFAHNGAFELAAGDADILIQLRDGDVMWQKERLLNVGFAHLPGDCEFVAWLDCDILFRRENWAEAAIGELERADLCHLYRTVCHLRPDAPADPLSRTDCYLKHDSIGFACASGMVSSVASNTDGVSGTFKRGHAWCARREFLMEHGLYDRNVIGHGDAALAFAATGQAEELIAWHGMTPAHAGDYRQWACRIRRAVRRIGYIEGDLLHLWHGDLDRRRYSARHSILNSSGYDPRTDIALGEDGCWRWNSRKPEMHRRVREYFELRDEDGLPSDPSLIPVLGRA